MLHPTNNSTNFVCLSVCLFVTLLLLNGWAYRPQIFFGYWYWYCVLSCRISVRSEQKKNWSKKIFFCRDFEKNRTLGVKKLKVLQMSWFAEKVKNFDFWTHFFWVLHFPGKMTKWKKIPTINEWRGNSELVGLGVVGSWGNRVIDGTGAVAAHRAGHLLVINNDL